ncbi:MAG: TonB family protein [Verrucomicrobia bacterium]|nr:TonB family protein [Verrucomicrobiota bacterium]
MKPHPFILFLAAWCALPLGRVSAQDVTVGEPVWFLPEPAPEELPKQKKKLRPDYPDEMRKTSEVGYVIVTRYLDETGKVLSSEADGSNVPFERAVEMASPDWAMTPAKRGGKPVNAKIWIPVIFNPKSASLKGPDATPRLLAITPLITAASPRPPSEPFVRVKLAIDANGAVTQVGFEQEVKPALAEPLAAILKTWRFAPARKGGSPVSAELAMTVFCQPFVSSKYVNDQPPRALTQHPPLYPIEMRPYALVGEVLVAFTVNTAGQVINPVVVESDNPAFDEPAIKAVLQWTFKPGTRDGQPLNAHIAVPIRFIPGRRPEQEMFTIDGKTDQSQLPPEFHYDTPPKLRGVLLPVYPAELRKEGVTGKAAVTMIVGPEGRVKQVILRSADRPEFGLALVAAAEGFYFEPALNQGRPVPYMLSFEQKFDRDSSFDEEAERLLELERKHPDQIVGANKLDAVPKPMSRRRPRFPTNVAAEVKSGEALVEFLIDEGGHARLPRIVSASDPAFGYAAVQTVNTWLFSPPLVDGKPVVTRVRIPVVFSTKSPAPASKPSTSSSTGDTSAPTAES